MEQNHMRNRLISRNGYEIDAKRIGITDEEFSSFIEKIQRQHQDIFDATDADMIVFDGELLPWNCMGKDLIERDFMVAYKACSSEHQVLRDTGFEEYLDDVDVKMQMVESGFLDMEPHLERTKKAYDNIKEDILPVDVMEDCLVKYKKQLDLFGSDGELDFKAFAILKTIAPDKTEENWISSGHTNLAMFETISTEPYCFINIDESDPSKNRALVARVDIDGVKTSTGYDKEVTSDNYVSVIDFFWDYVTNNKEMEGVVIKPNVAYIPGVAPYLKCRNTEYLRLTYGFEYDALKVKTERLIANKSIKRKLETSIKEYELGRQILNVPMDKISIDNPEWLNLCLQLINEQNSETELDPRL